MQCACGGGNNIVQPLTGRPRAYYSSACKQRIYRQRVTKLDSTVTKPTFYFSGIEKFATAQVLVKEQASGMISQLLYRENLIAACKKIPLVMDSGAATQ